MILNDYVVVEKLDTVQDSGDSTSPFLKSVTINNNMGIVVDIGKSYPLKKGDKVYYLGKYERAYYDNREVLVMKPDNIFKVIADGEERRS